MVENLPHVGDDRHSLPFKWVQVGHLETVTSHATVTFYWRVRQIFFSAGR